MDDKIRESIDRHTKLIQKLSTLSNVQLIVFVNILSIDNPEMFDIFAKVTEWENKILSEFMEENKKENYKENCEENNEKTNKKRIRKQKGEINNVVVC